MQNTPFLTTRMVFLRLIINSTNKKILKRNVNSSSHTGWSRKNTIGDNRFFCCQ